MNFAQLLQLLKSGNNPQQMVMILLQQFGGNNNPIIQNALNLAQKGDASALEQIARNLAQQKGIDFDKQFANFQQSLK